MPQLSATERYINPYTDFGFKRIFGLDTNKDLLIDFLNALISEHGKITTIQYLNSAQLGKTKVERESLFDIFCKTDKGEQFIVEMQKAEQNYFKDRSVYYSTFPIQAQAKKGKWNFKLNAVYFVGILDFVFSEDKNDSEFCYKHDIMLMDINKKSVFYDKLRYIYLEMPKFKKTEKELKTVFEKWMFVLKSLPKLQDRPKVLKEHIFKKLFNVAEVANFTSAEVDDYEHSLMVYRDFINVVDTAKSKGRKKGLAEGLAKGLAKGRAEGELAGEARGLAKGYHERAVDIARTMKSAKESVEKIIFYTSLTAKEIEEL